MEEQGEYITEHVVKLTSDGSVSPSGRFEIICITEGQANGWTFGKEALRNSLHLWSNVHCFIDHSWSSRSVRDLAGKLVNVIWSDDRNGILAELKPMGPASDLLTTYGEIILQEDNPPTIGFSADITFTANKREVKEIKKVLSLDLVYNPARGGAFLRALNSKGLNIMAEENNIEEHVEEPKPVLQKLSEDQEAMRSLLNETERQRKLDTALEEATKTRVQMCEYLLDSGLSASRLPLPIQSRIRAQYKGQVFTAAQLNETIEDSRKLLSELSGPGGISGPGRISNIYDEQDKLEAATEDLFDIPRSEHLASLDVPRLSGIRELYLMLTGDYELHGGFNPDRIQLATTADFTGLVKNALNKIVTDQWAKLGRAGYDWWKQISISEHFTSLNSITGTLIGTVGTLPVVAEGADYTELAVGDSPETADFVKYGGYIPLTLELIDRDQTRKLKAYARELGSAGLRKISALVSELFTTAAGLGPTMADTGTLFNATAVTTAGGHANLLTTALSINAWDAACTAVYNQPMLIKNAVGYYGTGPKMAINPKYCLVPRTLQNTAWQMLQGEFVREENYMYDNVLKGSGVPVTVPEWTDVNNWAAVCDPYVAPSIFVGERFGLMPEIFVAGRELSPAVFTNDEHRLKVRHFLAVWVNDFRPLHKSNVA
jgi:hypothetical protein